METPKYWQEEPGKIIDTGKNVLEYYPRAMKLSVAKTVLDKRDGRGEAWENGCAGLVGSQE